MYYRGESYRGRHKPLIDEETFELAQRILTSKSVKRSGSVYLLSSILECGCCGGKMRSMRWGSGEKSKLKILCYSFFPNSTKNYLVKDEHCPNVVFNAEEIEKAVTDAVMRFAVEYGEEKARSGFTVNEIADGLTAKKEKLSVEYSRLVSAYRKLGDEDLLEQASTLLKKIKKLERDIASESEKKTFEKLELKKIEALRTLPDTWGQMDDKAKQRVIRSVVEKVVISKDKIDVHLVKSAYDKINDGD